MTPDDAGRPRPDDPGPTRWKPRAGEPAQTLCRSAILDATLARLPDPGATLVKPSDPDATWLRPEDPDATLAKPAAADAPRPRPGVVPRPVRPPAPEAPGPPAGPEVVDGVYRVDGVVGQGAMGTVYRVHHLEWDLPLAVKTLRLDRLSDAMLALFRREAETWIGLGKHPYVCTAFYVRDFREMPALFLEYVEGGSLAEWMGKHPNAPLRERLGIALAAARGMARAHACGLVHRDLKPANILMTAEGLPQVTDFGLALDRSPRSGDPGDGMDCCGTPPYMPPEQWSRASESSPAADIYAFGVLLTELLTGRRPLEIDPDDPRPPEIAWRVLHLTERPRLPSDFDPALPPELDVVADRCLAKEPADRYPGFDALHDALRRVYRAVAGEEWEGVPYDPDAVRADDRNNRALSWTDLGRPDRAEADWREALAADPMHVPSLANLATRLWREDFHRNRAECVRLMNLLVEASPREGWFRRGTLLMETGDFAGACECAFRGLEAAPDHPGLHNLLGLARLDGRRSASGLSLCGIPLSKQTGKEDLGGKAPAAEAFRESLRLRPGHAGYGRNLDRAEGRPPSDAGTPPPPDPWRLRRLPVSLGQPPLQGLRSLTLPPGTGRLYARAGRFSNSFETRAWRLHDGGAEPEFPMGPVWGFLGGDCLVATFAPVLANPATGKVTRRFGIPDYNRIIGMKPADMAAHDVTDLQIAPRERWVSAVTARKDVHLWKGADLRRRDWTDALDSPMRVIRFRDEQTLFAACADGSVRLLEADTGRQLARQDLGRPVELLAFVPARNRLLTADGPGTLRVFDGEALAPLAGWETGLNDLVALAPFGDGDRVVTLSRDGTLRAWETGTGRCRKVFAAWSPSLDLTHWALSTDGRHLAVACTTGGRLGAPAPRRGDTGDLFVAETARELGGAPWLDPLPALFARVSAVREEVSRETRAARGLARAEEALAAGRPGEAWRLLGEVAALPGLHTDPRVTALKRRVRPFGRLRRLAGFTPGEPVAAGPQDRAVLSADGRVLALLPPAGGASPAQTLGRIPDPAAVTLADGADGRTLARVPTPFLRITAAVFTPDGAFLLAAGSPRSHGLRGGVGAWRTDPVERAHFREMDPPPGAFSLSPDGRLLAVASGRALQLLRVPDLLPVHRWDAPGPVTGEIQWLAGGDHLLFSTTVPLPPGRQGNRTAVTLWDAVSGLAVATLLQAPGNVTGTPWGSLLLLDQRTGNLEEWNLADLAPVGESLALPRGVERRLFPGPAPGLAVIAWKSGSVTLADLPSRRVCTAAFPQAPGAPSRDVTDARVSPDGRRLLTAGSDGHLRLWDLDGPRLEREWRGGGALLVSEAWDRAWSRSPLTPWGLEWDLDFPGEHPEASAWAREAGTRAGADDPLATRVHAASPAAARDRVGRAWRLLEEGDPDGAAHALPEDALPAPPPPSADAAEPGETLRPSRRLLEHARRLRLERGRRESLETEALRPLPPGLTPEEAWLALGRLRRLGAQRAGEARPAALDARRDRLLDVALSVNAPGLRGPGNEPDPAPGRLLAPGLVSGAPDGRVEAAREAFRLALAGLLDASLSGDVDPSTLPAPARDLWRLSPGPGTADAPTLRRLHDRLVEEAGKAVAAGDTSRADALLREAADLAGDTLPPAVRLDDRRRLLDLRAAGPQPGQMETVVQWVLDEAERSGAALPPENLRAFLSHAARRYLDCAERPPRAGEDPAKALAASRQAIYLLQKGLLTGTDALGPEGAQRLQRVVDRLEGQGAEADLERAETLAGPGADRAALAQAQQLLRQLRQRTGAPPGGGLPESRRRLDELAADVDRRLLETDARAERERAVDSLVRQALDFDRQWEAWDGSLDRLLRLPSAAQSLVPAPPAPLIPRVLTEPAPPPNLASALGQALEQARRDGTPRPAALLDAARRLAAGDAAPAAVDGMGPGADPPLPDWVPAVPDRARLRWRARVRAALLRGIDALADPAALERFVAEAREHLARARPPNADPQDPGDVLQDLARRLSLLDQARKVASLAKANDDAFPAAFEMLERRLLPDRDGRFREALRGRFKALADRFPARGGSGPDKGGPGSPGLLGRLFGRR